MNFFIQLTTFLVGLFLGVGVGFILILILAKR